MPLQALTGSRLRERRIALGLRQADLALSAGISPSYLNLIEHNRRRIAPELLARLALHLGVEVAALDGETGGALVDELRAAMADLPGQGAEADRIEDFAARFPGWAGLLVALHHRSGGLLRAVEALHDRLNHDPHLSAALHDMLSAVSSVRSTAGILAETPDIEPDWRARFLQNLHQDSERLALRAESLVAFLDGSDADDLGAVVAPQEEVEAWLAGRGWSLPELDQPEGLSLVQAEVAGLASQAARGLGLAFVTRAAQDAAALPGAAFVAALAELGPDPARLAQRFGVPLMPVFRRIALLPGSEAGLVLCDGSGTMTFQKPVAGFSLPRFGSACPLWPLFSALSRPMTPVEVWVETPAQRRFLALAFAETRYPLGFSGPELREAAMLILPAPTAATNPPPAAAPLRASPAGGATLPLRIGSTCRICPRAACPARREPSILSVEV